jgi:hypothetical protein
MVSHGVPLALRRRRPWALIAAALLLAMLSTILWVKWRDSRERADRLQAELRQVYAEAESLRTEATRAQQRIAQLEDELRARAAPPASKAPAPSKSKTTR